MEPHQSRDSIIAYGAPQPEKIEHFQGKFVKSLGYCPPSFV